MDVPSSQQDSNNFILQPFLQSDGGFITEIQFQQNIYNQFPYNTIAPLIPTSQPPISSSQHRNSLPCISTSPIIKSYPRRYTEGSISIPKKKRPIDDEEKRKQFLERNRKAALKCRQRKKKWLSDLQNRVQFLMDDNVKLQSQANVLKEEVINLKTLLLAHVDCTVAQTNGTTADVIQAISSHYNNNNQHHNNLFK